MLGLSGGIREYGRLAGEQPKRRMPVRCLPTAVSAAGRGWAPLPDG